MPWCSQGLFGIIGRRTGKKLEAAAQHWAKGGEQDDTPDDAKTLGVIMVDAPTTPASFEVWDENWDTVMMFMRMQTQWNVTMGGFVGLKYEVLRWLCDLYSVEDQRTMLDGLRIMEAAALQVLNDRS